MGGISAEGVGLVTYDELVDGTQVAEVTHTVDASELAQPPASSPPADLPSAEPAPSAEPDLDALLAQYDQEIAQQGQAGLPEPDPRLQQYEQAFQGAQYEAQQAQEYAQQVEQQAQLERDQRDGLELIKEIKGDLPIQDNAVGFFLDGALQANPRLMEVWNNRHSDPKTFEHVRHVLARELYKTFTPLRDHDRSEDKAAVIHAMRGTVSASEIPPEPPPNFGAMSDQELRDFTRKNFGFS
jgi:hypothetical protein